MVRHRALDVARKAGREITTGDDFDVLADANALSNSPHSDHDADASSLRRCLETLDEQRRDCVMLAFIEGYTQDEIARKLSAPIGTVKSWIRRGLLALKECLS